MVNIRVGIATGGGRAATASVIILARARRGAAIVAIVPRGVLCKQRSGLAKFMGYEDLEKFPVLATAL